MKQCITGKSSPVRGSLQEPCQIVVSGLEGITEGRRGVIVSLFVRTDDDTLAVAGKGG